MTPKTLKVPLAHDAERHLISIENAQRGQPYFCPSCGSPLILRKGEVKAPHFAHRSSNICNQETIIHKTAKYLLQLTVEDWKAGKTPAPVIYRRCQICRELVSQPIPDKVDAALVEYRLPNGYIADVVLMVDGQAQAAIEVRVTHAVDETKAANLDIPFIEVEGVAVLDVPTIWRPIKDRFKPLTCSKCANTFRSFIDKTALIAQRTGIAIPTTYYRYTPTKCWKCDNEILVFTWPDGFRHDKEPALPSPRPWTVQYRYSKTVGGKYWANTCPRCKALQGDFFLYMEPEGPFFSFDCGPDEPVAFRRDLERLAYYASYLGHL